MTGSNKKRDPHGGADPYSKLSHAQDQRRRTLPLVIGGTVLVVVVFALVAFLATRSEDDGADAGAGTGAAAAENATQETAPLTVTGEPLTDMPQMAQGSSFTSAADDPAIGKVAPVLKGETFDGSSLTIDPADGTPKVIIFVAHWCPHCQAEVPRIQEWIDQGNLPNGVEIVTVSTSEQPDQANYPPSKWIAGEGWTPPVLLDDKDNSAANAYGLTGFPYFVMTNGKGEVVARGSGEIPIDTFGAAVDALANGQDPTAAAG